MLRVGFFSREKTEEAKLGVVTTNALNVFSYIQSKSSPRIPRHIRDFFIRLSGKFEKRSPDKRTKIQRKWWTIVKRGIHFTPLRKPKPLSRLGLPRLFEKRCLVINLTQTIENNAHSGVRLVQAEMSFIFIYPSVVRIEKAYVVF